MVQEGTAGTQHLRDLQQAGLTHVHLLPSYDFGSVPERPEDQQMPQVRVHALACTAVFVLCSCSRGCWPGSADFVALTVCVSKAAVSIAVALLGGL